MRSGRRLRGIGGSALLAGTVVALSVGCSSSKDGRGSAPPASGVLTYVEEQPPKGQQPPPDPGRGWVGPDLPKAPPPPAPPPAKPPAPARLRVEYANEVFPVTVRTDSTVLGVLDNPTDVLSLRAGTALVRLVNPEVFLDVALGSDALGPGTEHVADLPPLASASIGVDRDSYAGLRVRLGQAEVAGPYPARIRRLVAGQHRIAFAWESGPLAGTEVVGDVLLDGPGHYVIRAYAQDRSVIVQKVHPRVLFITDAPDVEVRVGAKPVGRTVALNDLRLRLDPRHAVAVDRAVQESRVPRENASAFLLTTTSIDTPVFVSFRRECYIDTFRAIIVGAQLLERTDEPDPVIWLGATGVVRMRPDRGAAGCVVRHVRPRPRRPEGPRRARESWPAGVPRQSR